MIQNVNKYHIYEILLADGNFYYTIPKYQREYAWSYQQWEALYDDISENNDERSFINVFILFHEGCDDTIILNDTQDGTQGGTQDLADFGKWLEEQIRNNPKVTTTELALKSGKGIRTIKRYISKLPRIRYVGSGYSGHWEIKN